MRPLRNRCTALAAFAGSIDACHRPANAATYSSRPSAETASDNGIDHPPLEILQPPGSIHARTHFLKNGTERLEMSRRVYAIRDSFREIVVKTKPQNGQHGSGKNSVMSLSAMCSSVIGRNMQYEAHEETDDDMEGTNFVNELYDAVPIEYRRFVTKTFMCCLQLKVTFSWLVLSHGLNLILETNVQDATLFSILLDVTTSHGLLGESSAFLRPLLLLAFSPFSASTSRLSHPAHTTFLLDLRARWLDGGLPDPTFLSIIIEVLSLANHPDLWTCKAVKIFANQLYNVNFSLFMRFLGVCADLATGRDAVVRRPAKNRRSKSHPKGSPDLAPLNSQLHKWIKLVTKHCLSTPDSAEHSDAILEFLNSCLTNGLAFGNDDDTSRRYLQGAIIGLATHWLTGPFASFYPSDFTLVVNQLDIVTPHTSTYDTLIQGLFSIIGFDEGKQRLSGIARVLKINHLLHLESFFWGCALRHLELPEYEHHFITMHGADTVNAYRLQLIDIIEDADRRCFGPSSPSFVLTPNHTRKRAEAVVSGDGLVGNGWKWEAMVGSWVRDSAFQSSVKKRRFEDNRGLRHHSFRHLLDSALKTTSRGSRLTAGRKRKAPEKENSGSSMIDRMQNHNTPIAQSISRTAQHRLYYHRQSSEISKSVKGMVGKADLSSEDGSVSDSDRCDIEKHDTRIPRSSNFSSLIADALSKRTELHTPRRINMELKLHNSSESPELSSSPLLLDGNSASCIIFLPSDDALDLFGPGPVSLMSS
jgi:hypothetical protein